MPRESREVLPRSSPLSLGERARTLLLGLALGLLSFSLGLADPPSVSISGTLRLPTGEIVTFKTYSSKPIVVRTPDQLLSFLPVITPGGDIQWLTERRILKNGRWELTDSNLRSTSVGLIEEVVIVGRRFEIQVGTIASLAEDPSGGSSSSTSNSVCCVECEDETIICAAQVDGPCGSCIASEVGRPRYVSLMGQL